MAPLIDCYVGAPWYADHALPVWRALPRAARGRFFAAQGIDPTGLPPIAGIAPDRTDTPIMVFGYMDMVYARRIGRTRIVMGQHGAGQSYGTDHPSYPGGADQHGVGLFLVPNATAAARTRARYPAARVAVVGCPKIDGLPRRAPGGHRPTVAVSFHFDSREIAPEVRSAWRWYRMIVPALTTRYRLLGHGHPRARHLRPWYERHGIEVAASFEDVLRRADLYVCDNSSTLYEFAATGRPVVVLNAPVYRRGVEHGLRFWAAADVGLQVDDPRGLPAAIATALQDPPAQARAREAALDLVYQPRHGGADLAARAITGWLRNPAGSP